jgi:L-threonylcarbamoyladenylate synthase
VLAVPGPRGIRSSPGEARAMTIVRADAASIARAAALLRAGRLVAFPTETVYGLGADAENAAAVRHIFAVKGRPENHPLIVHVADLAHAARFAQSIPDTARALAEAFWPGPLTLIVKRAAHVGDVVTGGQSSVGLRAPSHPVAQALLREFGGGIAAPSANRFGHVSATTAQHVVDDLGDGVDLVLDGGPAPLGIESTIVALTTATPMLLRPGAIGAEAIARVLGHRPSARETGAPRASGSLPSHYAPRTPASLVASDALHAELAQLADRDERVAVLAWHAPRPQTFDGLWISAPDDARAYAHLLFANLRALDTADADAILIERVPDDADWAAIADRLARATSGEAPDDRD